MEIVWPADDDTRTAGPRPPCDECEGGFIFRDDGSASRCPTCNSGASPGRFKALPYQDPFEHPSWYDENGRAVYGDPDEAVVTVHAPAAIAALPEVVKPAPMSTINTLGHFSKAATTPPEVVKPEPNAPEPEALTVPEITPEDEAAKARAMERHALLRASSTVTPTTAPSPEPASIASAKPGRAGNGSRRQLDRAAIAAGLTREEMIAAAAQIVGRSLGSLKALTGAEADVVLAAFASKVAGR